MDKNVLRYVENVLKRPVEIEKLAFQGCTSEVFKVCTNSEAYVLKISSERKYREWLKNEALAMRKFADIKEVAMPKLITFWEDKDRSYLLMSYIQGITLREALEQVNSNRERAQLLTSFGCFLHNFHALTVNEQSNDWLERQLQTGYHYALEEECDGDLKLWEFLNAHRPNAVRATFIHGDCTIDNVLVVDGKVAYFIDVAGMTVGDPRYDEALAIHQMMNQPTDLFAFYEGYTRYKSSVLEFAFFNDGLYEFF
ncbi:phosphotransferase family protein [Lysinibacillus sphaericus]|uniref:phosphotransferase family protein n=1 Tax=Lysinibacillus sphaericus TaxID=1421 RepID=UPI003F7A587D